MKNKNKRYLKNLETEMKLRGLSPQTSKIYLFYNEKFLEYVKKVPKDITNEDIKEYIAYKKVYDSLSNASIDLIKASLKFYYSEILNKNISFIKTPKTRKKLPVVLTIREIKELIDKTKNPKHRLIIELLYSTGIRLSECINLKYSDLDLDENIGWVKNRIFIISKILKKDLIKYKQLKGFRNDDYIFSTNKRKMSVRGIQHAINISVKRAGIKKHVHVSTLRHSFASHLLENGVDIRKIQTLLGQTYFQTAQKYNKVSRKEIKKIKNPLDIVLKKRGRIMKRMESERN